MGGVSGSPVLFYYPPIQNSDAVLAYFQLPIIMGLVHGQYEDRLSQYRGDSEINKLINAGISIVVPASKIRETIMQDRLVESRKALAEETRETSPDAPKPSPASEEE